MEIGRAQYISNLRDSGFQKRQEKDQSTNYRLTLIKSLVPISLSPLATCSLWGFETTTSWEKRPPEEESPVGRPPW